MCGRLNALVLHMCVSGWMHQAVVMFVCVVCLCFVNSGPYDFDVLAGGCVV